MISRVHWVGVAALAMLSVATTSFAADSLSVSVFRPGRASIGGLVGGSLFLADKDYSHSRAANGGFEGRDSRPRVGMQATFRYVMTPSLRWQISPGWTWAGYEKDAPIPFTDPNYPNDATKEKILAQALPISAQVQYVRRIGGWYAHLGAGPNVSRVWVENRRKVLKDPVSKVLHRGFYPGVSGEFGAERFLKSLPSVSVEFAVDSHWIMAQRDEQFPSGFNSYLDVTAVKFGVNYFFEPKKRFEKKSGSSPHPAIPAGK